MADTRYESRYDRTERNVMWTIAFVILLLVMIIWGVWYFSRPDVGVISTTTTETGMENEVTPAAASDTITETSAGTTGATNKGAASDTGTVY